MATKTAVDLTGLRAHIAAVRAEMAQAAHAAVPLEEAEAAMDTFLESLATAYRPPVAMVFARDPQPSLDVAPLLFGDSRDAHAPWLRWAAVLREPLRAAWCDRLRAAYESDPALAHPVPSAERASRLAALQRQLAELEVAEERWIVEAEQRGEQIDRRADVAPHVLFHPWVLELEAPAT